MVTVDQVTMESMWCAISFYEALGGLSSEELIEIAGECGRIAGIYPLHQLLNKEFELECIEGKISGFGIITLLTVCTDLLTEGQLSSVIIGEWLPLSKHLSRLNN